MSDEVSPEMRELFERTMRETGETLAKQPPRSRTEPPEPEQPEPEPQEQPAPDPPVPTARSNERRDLTDEEMEKVPFGTSTPPRWTPAQLAAAEAIGWDLSQPEAPLVPTTQDGEEVPWYESAADLLAEPDPGPTPFLVEELVVDAAVAALVGRAKARKTWLLLEIAIAVATGIRALGRFAVPNPGPVLVIVEESGRAALYRRLDMLTRGRAIDPELLRPFFFAANRRVRLDLPEWRERLREVAENPPGGVPWRLIAFDPFVRVKGWVDENVQREVGPVLDFLRELRDLSGACVLYNHHTPHEGNRQRGSSDFEAYWESKLTLELGEQKHTLAAEHREAEATDPYLLAFRFDHTTSSLRIDADEDELARAVREHLEAHPTASANDVVEAVKGNRSRVLGLVRRWKETAGTNLPVPPGTTPSAASGTGGGWGGSCSTEPPTPGHTGLEVPVPGGGSRDLGCAQKMLGEVPPTSAEVEAASHRLTARDGWVTHAAAEVIEEVQRMREEDA